MPLTFSYSSQHILNKFNYAEIKAQKQNGRTMAPQKKHTVNWYWKKNR